MKKQKYALIIHGGAGNITSLPDEKRMAYETSLEECLHIGEKMLKDGAASIDVVEACVVYLENNDIFNAGRGSVINHENEVEMDAAIMKGEHLEAGSVIGLKHFENPISVARKVMEETEHVMLAGDGAEEFAESIGCARVSNDIFKTESRMKQAEEARKSGRTVLDVEDLEKNKKLGTVGAVAIDMEGHIASATSTGGISNKLKGRVGDSPIIGAGLFADDNFAGVSATGYGEQFLRSVVSFYAAHQVSDNCDAQEACEKAMDYLAKSVKGLGGIIMIDNRGNIGKAATSSNLIHGYVGSDVKLHVSLEP